MYFPEASIVSALDGIEQSPCSPTHSIRPSLTIIMLFEIASAPVPSNKVAPEIAKVEFFGLAFSQDVKVRATRHPKEKRIVKNLILGA